MKFGVNFVRSYGCLKLFREVFTHCATMQSLNRSTRLSLNFIIKGFKDRLHLRSNFC